MAVKRNIPRGIRNNNPGNIRVGNVWLGEVSNPTDSDFEQFVTMEYGVRAMCVLLRRYIRHYHKDTVAQIVSTWAPRSENDTTSYIDYVAAQLNIDPNVAIKYEDSETICKLVDAMTSYECGQHISMDKITKGYSMA